jgi:glutamate synthase domain-containing protein 3
VPMVRLLLLVLMLMKLETGSGDSSGVVYVYDRVGNSFNQVGILNWFSCW